MKRNDRILFLAVAFIVLVLFAIWSLGQKTGAYVTVYQDGNLIDTYNIYENDSVQIETQDGHYNLIMIEAGKVRVSQADCPDGLCVSQSPISKSGESIICLPHKLVVSVSGDDATQLDAVVQ